MHSDSVGGRIFQVVWERESLGKEQFIQVPPQHIYEAKSDPRESPEMGYSITQCKKNSQGRGTSGLNTPCDILSSDVDPPGEEWGYCASSFVILLIYYSHLDSIAL